MRYSSTISNSPFGSAISEMQFSSDTLGGYRFGFNGEEKENDIAGDGMAYDLGARFYDARLGRMFSLDPMMANYPWQSPYVYCNNSPVSMVDINGMGTGDEGPTPQNGDIRRINGVLEIYDANVVIKCPDGTETKGAWKQPSANLAVYISNKYSKYCTSGVDDGKDFSSSISAMADYTVYLYSTGKKYSEENIMKSTPFSQDILLSNGVLIDFKYISEEDAAKQTPEGVNNKESELYYDVNKFGNEYSPAPHGLTQLTPSGTQFVDFDRNPSDGSYINYFRLQTEAKIYGLNIDFLTGYIISHEIVHGLIIRAAYFYQWTKNTPVDMGVDSDGHSSGISLNQSGFSLDLHKFKNYQYVPQYTFKFPLTNGYFPANPYTSIHPLQLNYIKQQLQR